MDEDAIAQQLKANIESQAPTEPPEAAVEQPVTENGSDKVLPSELDELTIYKVSDYFGIPYKPSDAVTKQRINFIFNYVSQQIGSTDYLNVMSRVSELEQMLGSKHTENRIYRLYQWVGLDKIRQNSERYMRLLHVQ